MIRGSSLPPIAPATRSASFFGEAQNPGAPRPLPSAAAYQVNSPPSPSSGSPSQLQEMQSQRITVQPSSASSASPSSSPNPASNSHKSADDAGVLVTLNNREENTKRGYPSNLIRTAKYSLLSFLPKNLFEQFRRVSNFYFLMQMVIALIPGVSPIFPITAILPLAFVLIVTAIKDGIEDYGRHKSDKDSNSSIQKVLRNGILADVPSREVEVGDIVYVQRGQEFPADLVLLASALEEGICYVETSNLDGETNLKQRKAHPVSVPWDAPEKLLAVQARVRAEAPHEQLYEFKARFEFDRPMTGVDGPKQIPLSENQLLLRGARLRNTRWVYGLCVYAGVDTKLFKNLQVKGSKFSTLDKKLNNFLLVIFVLQLALMIICGSLAGAMQTNTISSVWFLSPASEGSASGSFVIMSILSYFILYSTMIPISLFVSLEIVKVAQAKFMDWDSKMQAGGRSMRAKTSALNDELGQVEYVFSDKTGTLTENRMDFFSCSVAGVPQVHFELQNPGGLYHWLNPSAAFAHGRRPSFTLDNAQRENTIDFLRALTTCHGVVPDKDEATGELVYEGQSTDEVALCKGAASNNFTLLSRSAAGVEVMCAGQRQFFEILATLEFTADRKRMSVVTRTPEGQIKLYCKGADSFVYPFCSQETKNKHQAQMAQTLEDFSRDGLRTLLVCAKTINPSEYAAWRVKFDAASSSLDNRRAKLEAVNAELERDMDIIGCTAIEDKLQDGVPETIQYLLNAGITLWVLTGDKRETAINIAYSSRLLSQDSPPIILSVEDDEKTLSPEQRKSITPQELVHRAIKSHLSRLQVVTVPAATPPGSFGPLSIPPPSSPASASAVAARRKLGIVIDGATLKYALADEVAHDFLTLCRMCQAAICCRVTPLQKALMVRLVQDRLNVTGLSIGDGANDVSMIQEAKVGVGVMGLEGTQAERAADYAIPRFRHLQRLLAVHGRYSYIRNSSLTFYSFYKNMLMIVGNFYFSIFNTFSTQTMFDSWIMLVYNIIFTSLPPVVVGLFEKDVPESVIERTPQLYADLKSTDRIFTWKTLLQWEINAICHASLIYWLLKPMFEMSVLLSNGKPGGIWYDGTIVLTISITVALLKNALIVKNWTWLNVLAIGGSLLLYYLFVIVYSAFPLFFGQGNMYFVVYEIFGSSFFWLALFFFVIACLGPDMFIQYVQRQYFPRRWQILQEHYILHEKPLEQDGEELRPKSSPQ